MYQLFNSHSMFQLTAPLREPTTGEDDVPSVYVCFNSRLPCGSRLWEAEHQLADIVFQLTAPLREPTWGIFLLVSAG